MTVLVTLSALCLVLAFLVGLLPWAATSARWLVLLGLVLSLCVAVAVLPHGINLGSTPPLMPDGRAVVWHLDPAAVWLYAFGAAGAVAAVIAGSPIARGRRGGLWSAGVAASVLGAVATMAVQNGPALLVSWEVMSLGGAFMLLSESASPEAGRSVLFMLGLLELGSLALMGALAWLGLRAGGEVFGVFVDIANGWPGFLIGLLLLIGFGAKLGLLPFYEWFPAAYASGSGATGAVLSGVVLNAAFFALARGLLEWVDGD
ncbi:MAG TPA: proton-conducting transporter membrane subunit, partial [Gammaproteobacteria bacterium]|nr:proton-conducting transporter membrane subunit [Gammaproteobacteria bacterium]